MMTSFLLAALTASPGTLAVPRFSGPLSPEALTQAAEQLAAALTTRNYSVVAPTRIAALLTPEQQGALKDCVATSCFTSFCGLLATESVVLGAVTQVEQTLQLTVKVVRASDGLVIAAARGRAVSLDALGPALEALALALVVEFDAAPAPTLPPPPGPPSLGLAFWTPVILGAVVLGAGGYTLGAAMVALDQARKESGVTLTQPEAVLAIERGVRQRNVGIFGMGLGAASIIAGALFGRPNAPPQTAVSVGGWLGPTGGAVVVRGTF
jgi:hypothetical protein